MFFNKKNSAFISFLKLNCMVGTIYHRKGAIADFVAPIETGGGLVTYSTESEGQSVLLLIIHRKYAIIAFLLQCYMHIILFFTDFCGLS